MTNVLDSRVSWSHGLAMLGGVLLLAPLWSACGSNQAEADPGAPDAARSGTGGSSSGGTAGAGGARLTGSGGMSGTGGTPAIGTGTGGAVGSGGVAGAGTGGGMGTGGRTGSGTGGSIGAGGRTGTGTGGGIGAGGLAGAAAGGGIGAGGIAGAAAGGGIGAGGRTGTGAGGATGTGGKSAAGGGAGSGAGGGSATGGSLDGGQDVAQSGLDGAVPIPAGAPGNPDGHCAIPAEAQLENVSSPTTVVGTGTPNSCTGDAFIAAVAKGGVITFNCGPDPATVRLSKPAKVFNDKGPKIVIDGGGKVTLSGEGTTRILYMNTCDQNQVWTSSHCDNQETPQLTVQNLTFANGNAKNESDGGGAIFASGGRLKVINSRFTNNVCADTGPDIGGGAIRAFQQWNGLPIYVVNSTFGGADGLGNVGSNGGALSSIGVSWTVLNTVISYNRAIGNGGNPATSGTPGGGSGGGIYNDGNLMTLTLCGTLVQYNQVNAYGSAIFFVSNDHTGNIVIDSSIITNNIGGSWYPTYPQISNHSDTPIAVTNSTIQ